MKDNRRQKISFQASWLKNAGLACLAGLLATACTPPTDSPLPLPSETPAQAPAQAPTQPAQTTPVKAAPANVPPAAGQPQASNPKCEISNAKINDPKPPTNIRSSPEVKPNNIVGKVENGRVVSVKSEKNGWLQITEPITGWISKSVAETECKEKNQPISFPPNRNSATISGRFIGTGTHKYTLKANQGQTLTVTSLKGSFPAIYGPDGKYLGGDPNITNSPPWTGKLPATGQYSLVLESYFKGYDYQFSAELK
ncbi:SH3 domain-containing protein [Microcoleus sp. FACHB-672]|uniref:SH3 domain-containing protein n=1 Tax=Microcoleus sp. FACHB-672 TaxID=2692825 RepID=UPI001682AA4B|nr:SH3 domain-containing protein [Microcoleus sp. FACHB-672]MBD2039608.1 SH3 domain-containing protein [Microcoleus sp. FACHB-672]